MDTSKNKRILWLLNHTTLRDGEVPMLLRLGYEVFIPKIVPFDEANRSASVTQVYDASLTIPQKLINRLNNFDFYNQPWPKSLATEINQYFGTAITAIFPKMVDAACTSFDGMIYLRIFGLGGDSSYAELFHSIFSKRVYTRIRKGQNIRLAASIANTIDNEPLWARKYSVYLPQGLPQDFYQQEDQWHGEVGQIFFVCPRINSNSYYNKIYRDFKHIFGDLPHIIAGAQPVDVTDDPHVTGFVEQSEYVEIFKSSKVMYYHSTEERHLHYHPIEAAVYGLPVIFMSGGVLEFLAKRKLPGCCDSPEEARIKVLRILNGDDAFTREVIDSQKVLLKEFNTQYVEESWRERFKPGLSITPQIESTLDSKPNKIVHIGMWMHETSPKGFTGEGISRLMAMILKGAQEHADIQFHIACVPWVKQAIIEYLDDLGVDTQRLGFYVVNEKPPLIYQVYEWWQARKPRERHPVVFIQKLLDIYKNMRKVITEKLVVLRPVPGFIVIAFIMILATPFFLILGILFSIFFLLKKILDFLIRIFHISKFTAFIRVFIRKVQEKIVGFAPRIYSNMVNAEMKLLAEKVVQENQCAAWFFAYPNNKFINLFNTPTVVAVPDIVYMDFPSKYSQEYNDLIDNHYQYIKSTINFADHAIAFSEYVRQNQVVKPGFQPLEKTSVIRHAPIETKSLISSRPDVGDSELRILAKRLISGYLRNQTAGCNDNQSIYLRSLNLGDLDYLYVSSQSRLHKNHLNLLKAYRILLREKYHNLKLVFTGEFSDEMQKYVTAERLHMDVLSVHYMPAKIHAAFYACASLSIVPTLFEGGFPFVFSESMSVGTPVVMSDIPVVREVLTEEERNMICFDPYSVENMVEKISWALVNRSLLLDVETKMVTRLKTRTWEKVSEEYLQVFTNLSKKVSEIP